MTPYQQSLLAEEFLRELARGIPDSERVMVGYASEATVQVDENGKKKNAAWWPKPHKDGKPINYQSNAYACISSSIKTANPKTGEMRFWRSEANFGHGLALMVDDIGDGKGSKGDIPLERIIEILPPTAVVETSPGNYQCWYFLDKPCDSLKHFKALLVSFVAYVLKKGGDNTIKDVTRFGRMPCGFNNKRGADGTLKYPDEKGNPFRVRLFSADYSVRYSMEEIAKRFGFTITIPQARIVEPDAEAYKWDAIWLKMAERICDGAKMGEGTNGTVSQNMSGKYRIRCPWGDNHTNGDPFGAYFRGPIEGADYAFVFGCGHDTCRKDNPRTWAAFIDEIVMPKIYDSLQSINDKAAGIIRK